MFAVCARLVAADPAPLALLLRDLPGAQLLVWTGTGEPPISSGMVQSIKHSFLDVGGAGGCAQPAPGSSSPLKERVSFDVALAWSWGSCLVGDVSLVLARRWPPLLAAWQNANVSTHLIVGVSAVVAAGMAAVVAKRSSCLR